MNNIILIYFVECKNDRANQLSNADLENIFELITNNEINISSHKVLSNGIDNLNTYI